MAIVYMGGYISGGMYNPALSLGAWVRGVLSGFDCFLYCVSQFLGGVWGGGVARFVVGTYLECGYVTAGKVGPPARWNLVFLL
jgi:aquaporin Z